MIRGEDIEQAISELEKGQPTYQTVQKLADLYIVRDHIQDFVSIDDSSEFLKMASGKKLAGVMSLMDELMETTQLLNPRLYESVMMRLGEIPGR